MTYYNARQAHTHIYKLTFHNTDYYIKWKEKTLAVTPNANMMIKKKNVTHHKIIKPLSKLYR